MYILKILFIEDHYILCLLDGTKKLQMSLIVKLITSVIATYYNDDNISVLCSVKLF